MTLKKKRFKTDVRKDEILRAALTLAVRDGYKNVTRVTIAEFIGVAETTVQYHFGTMARLRSELMRYAVKQGNVRVVAQGLADRHPQALKACEGLRRLAVEALVSL